MGKKGKKTQHTFSCRAFTLIELLVTVGIVVVLMALMFPVLSNIKSAANDSKCVNYQRQIVNGCLLYAADHENRLPPFGNSSNYDFSRSWTVQVSQYLGLNQDQIMSVNYGRCPLVDPQAFGTYGVNYGWAGNTPFGYENEYNSGKVSDFPAGTMICADSAPNGYIYSPLLFPLSASSNADYLAGKLPDASYNYMSFRHNGHSICGKIDGSVVRISVKDWVENAGNIWGQKL